MSEVTTFVPNEQVIPQIESRLFDDHQDAQFAVGMLAVGDVALPGLEEEFRGYLRLRANVYADQKGYISRDLVRDDGTEMDQDDERAVHFGILENMGSFQRVVGAMRVIIKSREANGPLPIEEFFPDSFTEPAPEKSVEVSRYICRHEDEATQSSFKWHLYTSSLLFGIKNSLGPVYAVVDKKLERGLKISGVPVQRIGDVEFLPEYNSENVPINIDIAKLARDMQLPSALDTTDPRLQQSEFEYFGTHGPSPVRRGVA